MTAELKHIETKFIKKMQKKTFAQNLIGTPMEIHKPYGRLTKSALWLIPLHSTRQAQSLRPLRAASEGSGAPPAIHTDSCVVLT